jgi:hypothetical protein
LVRKLTLQKARRDMFCMTDVVGLFVILGESFIRMSSSLYTEIYKKNTDSAYPDHCTSPLPFPIRLLHCFPQHIQFPKRFASSSI